MSRRPAGMMVLLLFIGTPVLMPQPVAASKYNVCALLTTPELEAALQAKVTKSQDADVVIDKGAYKGETMSTCTWALGTAYVNLNVIRAARTPEERDAGLARLRGVEDVLVKRGWVINRTKIDNAACATYKPPVGESTLPGASCMMESKGLAFALGVMGSVRITAQQVAALAGKVAARLP